MSDDRKQPTPIDADEYERFVQFVKDVHGGTRGHLRTEIENALREYRESYYDGTSRLQRIEDDVATVKAMLAEGESDGGVALPSDDADVRAPADRDRDAQDDRIQSKPPANQPRSRKAAWLAQQVRDRVQDQTFARPAIGKMVDDEYGFDDDAREALIDQVIQELDAEIDPTDPDELRIAWGDTLDERWEQHRAQQADEARAESERLTGDDVERGRR